MAVASGGALTVAWAPGRTLPVKVIGSGPPIVFAHGAGAGPDHPFMIGVAARLADAGFAVATFPYPYVAEGRRAPDRLDRLIVAHGAVVEQVTAAQGAAPFLAGKSMGGRVGAHLAVATPGWVCLGYPLVPMGKTEPRDTGHLQGPILFVQGERDRLAPLDLMRALVGRLPGADLVVVTGADHGFAVPKRVGMDLGHVLDLIADAAVGWMRDRLGSGAGSGQRSGSHEPPAQDRSRARSRS